MSNRDSTHHISSHMLLDNGTLIVCGRYGYICAIDASNGELLWMERINDVSGSPIIVGKRGLYADQNNLIARDIGNGKELWQYVSMDGSSGYNTSLCYQSNKVLSYFVKEVEGNEK